MEKRHLTLPMFPLAIVVLPGETTKIHIYEERYKQLVKECWENTASFGIPFVDKGQMMLFGSEVSIKKILKTYDNGEMDILIEGTGIFKLLEFTKVLSPKLYGAGTIEMLPSNVKVQLPELQDAIVNYFGNIQNQFLDYETVSTLHVFSVAASLHLTHTEKYKLISSPNPQLQVLGVIKFIHHIIKTESQIKDRFINN